MLVLTIELHGGIDGGKFCRIFRDWNLRFLIVILKLNYPLNLVKILAIFRPLRPTVHHQKINFKASLEIIRMHSNKFSHVWWKKMRNPHKKWENTLNKAYFSISFLAKYANFPSFSFRCDFLLFFSIHTLL